jgi:hypothetical protein
MRQITIAALAILLGGATAVLPQNRAQGNLRPGDMAVDFTLAPSGGGPPVTLSSFRGKSPVALVFGSYT